MKIAFVIPWYGENIPGGAESLCRNTAKNLKASGLDVEVLTTCVKDFHGAWEKNYHDEGVFNEGGIKVRRFKVEKRDKAAFAGINAKLMNTPVESMARDDGEYRSPITVKEEEIFIREMLSSPGLHDYIKKSRLDYNFFLPIPYMFSTTYYTTLTCPEKTLLIPCLHDESYAYMDIYKNMARKSRGLIFNTEPEKRLAKKLYGLEETKLFHIGAGLETGFSFDAARFVKKYGIKSGFILCAGRKDTTKNTDLLIDYFARFKASGKDPGLKLVLMGSGNVHIPDSEKNDIIDLGFVPTQDKLDAHEAALFLCNPSINESFSIVLMESWLTQTPVLVNGKCEVTRDHCLSSNGGLYFSSFAEFRECVELLSNNGDLRKKMGANGRKYVLKNYSWDIITKKYRDLFGELNGDTPVPGNLHLR